jgi:hypothetical protein
MLNNRWRACILKLINQQQVARMYDVFWPLELSSKCFLAALAFLMWPNIILEFNLFTAPSAQE